MSVQLLSYEYLSSMVKPYVSDLSVALVFGVGYYLFKYLHNNNQKPINNNEIKKSIKTKLDKWEQAKTLQVYNGLIIQNHDTSINAFNILTKMQKSGISPDIITYNCLIDMSFRFDQSENAQKLFEEVCDSFSGVQPDVVTFNIMLKHYVTEIKEVTKFQNISNELKMQKVFKILADIKTRELQVNEITYNTAMDACVEVGDFNKTWDLFNEMKSLNLVPDLYTYATLVKGLKICGCSDSVEKAIQILDLVKNGACNDVKADEVLYNSVLDICIRNNKVDLADKIFEEMKTGEIKPSIVSYSIMIRGYGLIYNIEKAFALYDEIKENGLQSNDIVYGCLMNCAVRCSNINLMIEIYERMKSLSMKPNSIIYTTLIKGYNKMKLFEKAFEIFDNLTQDELNKSTIVIYNAILDVCVESGNSFRLKEIYDNIKTSAENLENFPQPNIVTYSTVIKGYIRNKNIEEAMKIYNFLKENNFKLDEIFFSIIIDGLAASGDLTKASAVFAEMKALNIKRSSVIYSVLIKMYSRVSANSPKDTDKAVELIHLMKEDGIKPSIIAYTTLMQMYLRKKQIKEAINMFNQIKKEGLEPDQVCYNFIINGCTFNQNLENAIKFLLESLEKNVKLNDETYKNTLEYLLNNKFMKYNDRVKNASDCLNALKIRNIQINYDLYSRLMRLIYKNNEGSNQKRIESNISTNFNNFSSIYKKN